MNFDTLAPHYRWMEWILAGNKLQKARTRWLREIAGARRVLLVGEGSARCIFGQYTLFQWVCFHGEASTIKSGRHWRVTVKQTELNDEYAFDSRYVAWRNAEKLAARAVCHEYQT